MHLRALPPLEPPRLSASVGLGVRRALGGLLPLLDTPGIRDLLVQVRSGAGEAWIDRGGALEAVPGWRVSAAEVRRIATDLVSAGGRRIDELHPCADVGVGAGIRVHAVLPPVSAGGTAISIRLPGPEQQGLRKLIESGLCDTATGERIAGLVDRRRNVLISGGTGSGKTTLLGALLDEASAAERVVTIEDVAELRLRRAHWVSLETRSANPEGTGAIVLDQLLREALRMRPDRIALGECRGAEVATLLTALNTGHDGSAGTVHANRLEDVPARLEALGASAGLSAAALGRQTVAALHAIIHLERGSDGRQRVAAMGRPALSADRLEIRPFR